MNRKERKYAITKKSYNGPIFGNDDIYIRDNCNKENSCFIANDDNNVYECDSRYKRSLFVNTAGPNENNWFSVLEYEVFIPQVIKRYHNYYY